MTQKTFMFHKRPTFEIYEGLNGRKKKYIVLFNDEFYFEAVKCLKKLNHCSEDHIHLTVGYIWKDELYLRNPAIPGAKLVTVLTYIR